MPQLTLVRLDHIYTVSSMLYINRTEFDKIFVVDAQIISSLSLFCMGAISIGDVYFFVNINICRHLKLEIALAIPALNE